MKEEKEDTRLCIFRDCYLKGEKELNITQTLTSVV
jgi:hypothetical protein